jgi:hypothetical protein
MSWDFFGALSGITSVIVDNPFYLIILLAIGLMIPLALLGIYSLIRWLDDWRKIRAGWIVVRKKLSNGRWIEFWARPVGRKIAVKGEEGMNFEIPVSIEKDYMGYQKDVKNVPLKIEKNIRVDYDLNTEQFEEIKKLIEKGKND